MADILIIFGSSSDSKVYDTILENTENSEVIVCSAHRSPDVLSTILKKSDAKVLVAGAGLAAHLPGVMASQTIKPVIGVPVNSNFQGLDALLAIVQMPPGMPVLCVGVNNAEEAARYSKMMLKQYNGITITGDIKNERVEKAVEILEKFEVPFEISDKISEKNVNLQFGNVAKPKGMTINIPLLDTSKVENALQLMHMMKRGIWVGVGRAENAAIAAVEILNFSGDYTKKLNEYRGEMRQKIIDGLKTS